MEINKENYEAFLLDLWEGTLSEDEKVMLDKFLRENPLLNEEDSLNLLDDISISEVKANFDKSSVDFEKINTKNYEFFFIAYAEGDLSSEEMKVVDLFLKENPTLNQKFKQFNKTKLPEEIILYPHKEKLAIAKTPVISLQTSRWIIGFAAASIALLLWFSSPFESPNHRYTMTGQDELEIDRAKIELNDSTLVKNNSKSIHNRIENRIAEAKSPQVILKKENTKSKLSKKNKLERRESKPQLEISNPNEKSDLIAGRNVESNDLPDVVTSIISVGKVEEKNTENQEIISKNKPQTIGDIATNFLQRRNVLDEEGKPDLKGMLNNTFSNANENKKPIIVIEDEPNTKTTIFQLGSLKIERKRKK